MQVSLIQNGGFIYWQVKLNYQEQEIVCLLKRIPLMVTELLIIRNKAQQLCNGTFPSRGDALLPTMLATYIFDALCLPCELIHSILDWANMRFRSLK